MENPLQDIVDEILHDINLAIDYFGSYTYNDKGADEVMNISKYTSRLRKMKAEEVIEILESLDAPNFRQDTASFLYDVIDQLRDWNDGEGVKFQKSYIAHAYA